jgi:hypothetical protein
MNMPLIPYIRNMFFKPHDIQVVSLKTCCKFDSSVATTFHSIRM